MNKQPINYHEKQYLYPDKLSNEEWLKLGKLPNLLYDAVRDPNTSICFIYNLLTFGKANVYDLSTLCYLQDLFIKNKDKSKAIKYCLNNVINPQIDKFKFKSENSHGVMKYVITMFSYQLVNFDCQVNGLTGVDFINDFINLNEFVEKLNKYDGINKDTLVYDDLVPLSIAMDEYFLSPTKINNSSANINHMIEQVNIIIEYNIKYRDMNETLMVVSYSYIILFLCRFGNEQLTDYIYTRLPDLYPIIPNSYDMTKILFLFSILASNNINLFIKYCLVFFKEGNHVFTLNNHLININKKLNIITIYLTNKSIKYIMSLSNLYDIRFMQIITNYNGILNNDENITIDFKILLPSKNELLTKFIKTIKTYGDSDNHIYNYFIYQMRDQGQFLNFIISYEYLVKYYLPKTIETMKSDLDEINKKYNLNIKESMFIYYDNLSLY